MLAVAAFVLAGLRGPAAHAPVVDRAAIEWIAPAGCPTAADVDALAERLLLAADGHIEAQARVVALSAQELELALTIAGHEQRFTARDCGTLVQLTALLVAVAADPVAVATVTAEPPTIALPPLEPSTERAVVAPADVQASAGVGPRIPPERKPPPPPLAGILRAYGIVGVAELPGIDAGVGIAGALERGRFAVELHGSWLSSRPAGVPGLAPATIELTAVNASLRGCGILGQRSIRVALCAGPELGAVLARAVSVETSDPAAELWVAAIASPGVAWRVHRRIQLMAGVDLVLALWRPQFALRDDSDARVSVGRGGLRAWLGVGVRLGPGAKAHAPRGAAEGARTHP